MSLRESARGGRCLADGGQWGESGGLQQEGGDREIQRGLFELQVYVYT